MGGVGPFHKRFGNINFFLSRKLDAYAIAVPPPSHVKPLPTTITHCLNHHLYIKCTTIKKEVKQDDTGLVTSWGFLPEDINSS